jgi:hypothetical protein
MSSDSGNATLRAVYNGVTLDKVFSISKSKAGTNGTNGATGATGTNGTNGTNGTDAKALFLLADSQVFQVAKAGTVSPSTVTFTATPRGALTGTATWSVTSGTATLTGTGNSRALTPANMTTDTATVTVTITDASGTYTDAVTMVKVREGTDTINAYLTNESQTVPADSNGLITSYTGAATDIKVFVGATDDSANWTISKVDSTGITSSVSTRTITLTNCTVDSGYVDITAAKSGYTSLVKRFNITRAKAGATGATGPAGSNGSTGAAGSNGAAGVNAVTSFLTNDAFVVSCDNAGNALSGALTAGVSTMKVINGTTDDSANWIFMASPASSASNVQYTLSSNTLTMASISNTIDSYSITITATRSGYPTLTKLFSISKSKAGAAGANGTNGAAGANGATGPTGPAGSNGSNGAAGQRGTMTMYVNGAGWASWNDTYATNAFASYGGKMLNDVVTEYNSNGGWSETRFWNGSAWVSPGQIIDGNLLVTGTIGASKISANSITADKMSVTSLSAVSASLGTMTSGRIQSADGSFVIDFTNKYINITV